MIRANSNNDEGSSYRQETSIFPFAIVRRDVRIANGSSTQPLRYSSPTSTVVLSLKNGDTESPMMMPLRRRVDSLDSTASSSSTFSLVPRTTSNHDNSRPTTPVSRRFDMSGNKGMVLVPQSTERPIIEFSFGDNNDEIPDHLLVPML